MSDDNYLRTGDLITLKFVRFQAYLSAEGILSEDVYVSTSAPAFEDHLFQICAQRQYSAKTEYADFIEKLDGKDPPDEASKKHFAALVRGKGNEMRMNEVYMRHKIGNNVLFGDVVQLLHVKSRKYLTVQPGTLARDERENMRVHLSSEGSIYSWMQLLPRYKIDREGDRISNNTEIVMHVSERASEHIHCSDRSASGTRMREVNASLESGSPWRLNVYQSSQNGGIDPTLLKCGQLVYIRDPEFATLLQVFIPPVNAKTLMSKISAQDAPAPPEEHDNDLDSVQQVSLSGSQVSKNSKRSQRSQRAEKADIDEEDDDVSISSADEFVEDYGSVILKPSLEDTLDTNCLWVVESKSVVRGGNVAWKTDQVHLRHLNTGRYLSTLDTGEDEYVLDSCLFTTLEVPSEKHSLFSMFELHSQNDFLMTDKAIQLRQGHMYITRSEYNDRWKSFTCNGTRNRLKATNLIISRYTEKQDETVDLAMDVHVGMSFLSVIQHYLDYTKVPSVRNGRQNHIWPKLDAQERGIFGENISQILSFVKGFPIVSDEHTLAKYKPHSSTIARRQRLFREQGSLQCLLLLLCKLMPISERLSSGDAAVAQFNEGGLLSTARIIVSTCMQLLFELSRKNSANQLFIAEFMGVVLAHCSAERVAAEITQEMLSTNRALQETKIGPVEIRGFAEKLHDSQMSAMFLRLIQACCSCQGVGISNNQINVADILLGQFIKEFIVITVNDSAVRPMDWTSSAVAALYLPPSDGPSDAMLGHSLYSQGAPFITLSWTNKDLRVSPQALFNKSDVKIGELYQVVNMQKAENDRSQGASLFSVLPSKQTAASALGGNIEFKLAVGEYFGAQLRLAADMCLDRNYTVISKLAPMYPYEALVSMVKKPSTPSFVKASCLSLLTNMYVDCDPQIYVVLPRLTRTWTELASEEGANIRTVNQEDIYRFGLLQYIISEHMRSLVDKPYQLETRQMMILLNHMLTFGFYGTQDRLKDAIDPIVAALDRRNMGVHEIMEKSDDKQTSLVPKIRSRRASNIKVNRRDATGDAATSTAEANEASREKSKDAENAFTAAAAVPELDIDEDVRKVKWQSEVLNIFESLRFTMFMLVLVVASVTLAVYQYVSNATNIYFSVVEAIIFAGFCIDVIVRAYCFKIVRGRVIDFVCDPFNFLDIIVVALDAATYIVVDALHMSSLDGSGFTKIIKVVRILRLMRFMRFVKILNAIAAQLTGIDILSAEWSEPEIYSNTSPGNLLTMVEMSNILCTVQLTVEDRNVSLLMRGFYDWFAVYKDKNDMDDESVAAAISAFHAVTERMQELRVSSEAYDDIFIDLMMYHCKDLVQGAMNILMTHHCSRRVLLADISRVQLLVNQRREQQYEKLDKLLILLKRECDTHDIWGRLATDEQKHTSDETHRALKDVKQACFRRREVLEFDQEFEPDRIIQDILRNLGCFDICIKFIRLVEMIDPHNALSEQSRNTRTLALEASELLFWFTFNNSANQALAYKHIAFFMKHIDANVKLHKVLEAIFYNNEFLMKLLPRQYISDSIDLLVNSGRFMQYLSLLGAIVNAGGKNMIENQYEIIRILASPGNLKKVILYFVSTSHPDYQKKLKGMHAAANKKDVSVDDLPADLAYHLNLLSLMSGCTVGRDNMTTIEAKVQSMFSFVDVVEAILDPNTILVAKVRTALFFYNSMLDVEMRLPSLKDAKCVWDLLETFPDVFSFGKDDLRQIEKNGWAAQSSCRQKVEYMIVCAMVTSGYFKHYFDSSVFRPEIGAASAVERVQMREKKAFEIVNSIFFKIRSVYEMQSPLLAMEHQQILFDALVALNDANPNKIVLQVENVHQLQVAEYGDDARKIPREEKRLRQFLDAINTNKAVEDMLQEEMQDFITKLDSLPRKADLSSTMNVRYEPLISRIISHISSTIQIQKLGDEVVKFIDEKATSTGIWFIKIFRTMIENRWGMTIHERDDDGGEEQDIAAEDIMRTLNDCGATTLCLNLLGRGINEELQAEAIKLIVALLFKEGGAHECQKTINMTLNKSGSDLFFQHMRHLIGDLIAWHKWHGVITLEEGEEPKLPENIILIRMLQLMCEGHYTPNQNILREQPNNRTNVNLLDDFTLYLQILDENKCRTSTVAANAVTATVLEVIQGPCEKNQDYFALSTELLETLNRRMRHHVSGDCDEDEENEVKKTCVDIFQGLLEGQGRRPAIYDRVLSVIHLDVIKMITTTEVESGTEVPESLAELKMECLVFLMGLFDFKQSIRAELDMEEETEAESEVACVEVVWRGELQRRFFNVPEICFDIAKSSKDDFIANADRESPEAKLFDLISVAKSMRLAILHQQVLKEWGIAKVFSRQNVDLATKCAFFLALIVNSLFVAFYENVVCEEDTPAKDDDAQLPSCLKMQMTTDSNGVDVNVVAKVFGILLILVSIYIVLNCFLVRLPVIYEAFIEDGLTPFRATVRTAFDLKTLYHTGYLVLASLSVESQFHHLASFLLLDMITMSPVTQDTLNAIWKPRRMLFMTVLLTFICIYVYAIMAFFLYNNADNFTNLPDMASLFNAFKEFLMYGSPSASLNGDQVQTVYASRWFAEVTFYMVCFTLWNVIKGITIDTFVELRRDLVIRMEDTTEKCYMCGIEKMVFNRALDRNAFDIHVKKDQNLWNYVYYCIFVWEQDKDDDDGLEYYIRHCIDDGDLGWFPMNKAIRLTEHLEAGAADSLPYQFRNDLGVLEGAVEDRMGLLKDTLLRSITRVEQALVYQPELTKQSKKKRPKDASSVSEQQSASLPQTAGASRLGSSPFRPMTGSVGAEFSNLMDGGMSLASGPLTADDEVEIALTQREKSLEFWRDQTYMDSMQVQIACNDLEGLFVSHDMIGNISIRILSDTGIFICSSAFDDASTLAETSRENKDDRVVKSSEPINFNKSQFFAVHGGSIAPENSKQIVVQVIAAKEFVVPAEVADAYPSVIHKCLAHGSLRIDEIIVSSIGTGLLSMPLKQISADGSPLPDCTLRLNTTSSEEIITLFQSHRTKP